MRSDGQWRTLSLGEFLAIKHGYAFKGKYFAEEGDYIVLTPGNFFDEGGFRRKDQEKYYAGEVPDGYILREGDLIVAMTEQSRGLLGSSALVPEGDVYLHNQRLGLVVDLDESLIDKHYLYYLFNTHQVREQIQATASGTKVRHTSPSRISEVKVSVPPVEMQRAIAAVLSAYDELLKNNTRRIEILEGMAQAIYREWFVNFRYPGHEDVEMVESELGPIPEGWEVLSLSDVAEVNAENVRKDDPPDEILYINISSVSSGRIDEVEPMPWEDSPSRARRIVHDGDVIWSTVRPNLRSFALVLDPEPHTIASTGFAVLTPRHVPFSYLYCYSSTDWFAKYLDNHTRGAAYPAVNVSDFKQARILAPPEYLLEEFHSLISPGLRLRRVLEKTARNLQQARDLLLPKLVSGEIDVSDFNIDTSGLPAWQST